jgi:hypothetical protein
LYGKSYNFAVKKDLIKNGAKPKKIVMNNEIKQDTKSGKNWDVKYDSGKFDHCKFCLNQVPSAKRPRMEETLKQIATPVEIQAWNRQWPGFGPGQALGEIFDSSKHDLQ